MLLLIKETHNQYGIDANQILEVTSTGMLSKVAGSQPCLLGLCNYKNTPIPVLSFARLAGEEVSQEPKTMIIISWKKELVALGVTQLGDLCDVTGKSLLNQRYMDSDTQQLKIAAIYAGNPAILEVDITKTLENLKL